MTAPHECADGRYFLRVVERDVEALPVLLDVDLLVDAFEVDDLAAEALLVDDLGAEALLVEPLLVAALLVEALAVDPFAVELLAVELLAVDPFAVEPLVVDALLVLVGADLLAADRLVDVFAVELLAEVPRDEVVLAVLRGDVLVDAERLVEREEVFGADLVADVRVEVLRVDVRLVVPGREDAVDLPVLFDDVLAVVLFDAVRAAEALVVLCFGSFFEPLTTSLKWVPARKAGTLVFLTRTASPVRGLRAVRAARARFSNTPKPVIVTFSPLLTVRTMMSTRLSTASDAVFLSPRRSPSASISSALLAIGSPP